MEENKENRNEQEYEKTYDVTETKDEGLSKLVVGGIFAAGAAAGAITTKVIIPGGKKAVGWIKGKFSKKDKAEKPESEEEKGAEESSDEKETETKDKKKKKSKK